MMFWIRSFLKVYPDVKPPLHVSQRMEHYIFVPNKDYTTINFLLLGNDL